jgi:hypothetical protein
MFWPNNDPATHTATFTQTPVGARTIDASTEHARLQALTGTQQGITIAPRQDRGFKLPGL